jgi:hypothetical protein
MERRPIGSHVATAPPVRAIRRTVGTAVRGKEATMASVDDDGGLLNPEESLDEDELDEDIGAGFSPAERAWGSSAWGTTDREASTREDLEHRLAREERERDDDGGDDIGDASDTDGELIDDQVGRVRSGRLVVADAEADDPQSDLWAHDVGIDGAAASAEEAAVHVIADDDGEELGSGR